MSNNTYNKQHIIYYEIRLNINTTSEIMILAYIAHVCVFMYGLHNVTKLFNKLSRQSNICNCSYSWMYSYSVIHKMCELCEAFVWMLVCCIFALFFLALLCNVCITISWLAPHILYTWFTRTQSHLIFILTCPAGFWMLFLSLGYNSNIHYVIRYLYAIFVV